FGLKKMECGIGASSHSFEKWSASIRNAVYLPFGVSWASWPVETGQIHRRLLSTSTFMRWLDLSIVTTTAARAGAADTAMNAATATTARRQRGIKPRLRNAAAR